MPATHFRLTVAAAGVVSIELVGRRVVY